MKKTKMWKRILTVLCIAAMMAGIVNPSAIYAGDSTQETAAEQTNTAESADTQTETAGTAETTVSGGVGDASGVANNENDADSMSSDSTVTSVSENTNLEDKEEKPESDETSGTTTDSEGKEANAESYPAVSLNTKTDDGTEISISAPEGAFPSGIQVSVTKVDPEQILSALKEASDNTDLTADQVVAYDFDFYLDNGEHNIEPRKEISVQFSVLQLKKDDSVTAYHLNDENSPAEKEDVTADVSAGTATLESGKFSIHALLLGSAINTATVVIDYDKNTDIHSVADSGGNRIILYCMNNGLHWPHTTPTISSVPAYSEITFDEFCKQNGITDSAKISNIEEQLKTILYAGYPYNGLSLYQINTGTATSISESEFNQMLIPPDVLRTDFPDSIGQNAFTYSSEYLDNSSEKYQLLNKFMQEELALYFSGGSTQSGLTSQQIRALPFYKAVNSLLNNPNDPFTTYAQFYGEGYFLTDSQAYANTSNAVWTLMDNNGVPNNNPVTQTVLSTSLLTASGTNILSAEPSNSEAAITGDTTFHRNSTDGKWYTGTLTLTAPDSWKQTFELTLPKGITTTNGQSQIQIGESFVLVSEKEPTQEETVTVSATIPWMDGKLRVYEPATTAAAADGKGFQNMVGAVIKKTQISLSAKLNTAITISGTKTWDDGNNQDGKRPKSITVKLLANNVEKAQTTVEADNKGNWTYSFENLPKYEDGKEVAYTVTEDKVDGYTTSYRGYNITNSYTPGKISVIVAKAWDDQNNQDGKRPGSVQVQLYADKKAAGDPVTLTEAGKWMHTWESLDEMSAGKKIEYTVKEVNVPEGYDQSVNENSANSFIITNSHTLETTSVSGTKMWEDGNDKDGIRPDSVQVQLLANGKTVGDAVTLNEANQWKNTWTNLPKYANGKEIVYSVEEVEVPSGYSVSYSGNVQEGFVVTNKHTPEKTSPTTPSATPTDTPTTTPPTTPTDTPTTTPPATPTDTPTTTPTTTPTDTPTATPTTIPTGTPTATPSSTPGAPAVPRTPGGNNTNNRNTNQTTGDNSSKVSTGKVSTGRVATGDDTNNRIWQISMIVSSALLVLFVIMVILNRKRDK